MHQRNHIRSPAAGLPSRLEVSLPFDTEKVLHIGKETSSRDGKDS
jgi:hypothetical protein